MSGENGTNGATRPVRVRDYYPDPREVRRLLGKAMGVVSATQERLAELLGCSSDTVKDWEGKQRRHRPSRVFRARLVELEARLRARKFTIDDDIFGREVPVESSGPEARSLPLTATEATVTLEGERALLRFSLKVPGEADTRTVAEVLVAKSVIAELIGKLFPSS